MSNMHSRFKDNPPKFRILFCFTPLHFALNYLQMNSMNRGTIWIVTIVIFLDYIQT
jgi:hypothetical protein